MATTVGHWDGSGRSEDNDMVLDVLVMRRTTTTVTVMGSYGLGEEEARRVRFKV